VILRGWCFSEILPVSIIMVLVAAVGLFGISILEQLYNTFL
jgi:hypothetical protein